MQQWEEQLRRNRVLTCIDIASIKKKEEDNANGRWSQVSIHPTPPHPPPIRKFDIENIALKHKLIFMADHWVTKGHETCCVMVGSYFFSPNSYVLVLNCIIY